MKAPGRRHGWAHLALVIALAWSGVDAADATLGIVHGGRVAGRVLETGDPAVIRVVTEVFSEPLEFGTAAVVRAGSPAAAPPRLPGLPGRVGLLTAEGLRLLGCLASCGDGQVGWQPLGSTRPVAFAPRYASPSDPDATASIDYRGLDAIGGPGVRLAREVGSGEWTVVDVQPAGSAGREGRLRIDDRVANIAEGHDGRAVPLASVKADAVRLLLLGPVGSTVRLGVRRESGTEEVALVREPSSGDDLAGAAAKDVLDRALAVQQALRVQPRRGPATVHLVTGESFTAAVLAADEATVRVDCGDRGERVIPGDRVRALELSAGGMRPILKQKLARLLTVPRLQQATPPTHVLRMSGGDYVRGRLVAVDAEVVKFDVAGGVKSFPRRDVARIIRLTAADEPPPRLRAALADLAGLPLVVEGADGRRQGLAATGLSGGALVGDSPTVGPTSVSLGDAVRVLLGGAIDEAAAADNLPYAPWVLRPAPAAKAATPERP